jgi:hypothetical protein
MSQPPPRDGSPSATVSGGDGRGRGLNRQIDLAKAWFPAALLLITLVAMVQRLPGIEPPSLYLDDQWVALLVRDASVGQILDIRPPASPGFLLILKAIAGVGGMAATTLQAMPFLCGLAAIPLFGWTVSRWSGHAMLGVIAALLLALDPFHGVYSLRVKPFTADALVTIGLLALTIEALRSTGRRWLIALACVAAVTPLVSIPSLIIGGVLVNAVALAGWWKAKRAWSPLAVAAAYAAAAGALYFTLLAGQRNPSLVRYWAAHFPPLEDTAALGAFFTRGPGAAFFLNPFPAHLWWVPVFLLSGVAWLIIRREHRPLGALLGLAIAAMLAASALRLYPIGTGRLDLFLHPVLLLIAAVGFTPPRIPPRFPRWLPGLIPGTGITLLTVGLILGGMYGYPPVGDRQMVERAVATLSDDDGLVVYPWANYAAGLYGPWPTEIVPVTDSTNRFYVHLRRPNTLVLHESLDGVDFQQDPRVMMDQLKPFVDRGYRRIVYVSGTTMPRPHGWACGYLISRGYRVTRAEEVEGATLVVFER